jgi:hypothetical protein
MSWARFYKERDMLNCKAETPAKEAKREKSCSI